VNNLAVQIERSDDDAFCMLCEFAAIPRVGDELYLESMPLKRVVVQRVVWDILGQATGVAYVVHLICGPA
jgi:hypothetical protein